METTTLSREGSSGMASIDKSIPIPRYYQLKTIIRQGIKKGNLRSGNRVGPAAKLAAAHKVSKATVERALSELIDEGVLYSEIGRGTFVADPADKKTHTICFVVYSADYITMPYFSQLVAGIGRVTEAEHYKLQFITSERAARTINGQAPYPSIKEGKWADGLVIMDNVIADDQVASLAKEFPVVMIDRKIPGTDIACVRADDRGGTYRGISYLASLGHKRIGIIVGSSKWRADKEKLLGYHSAVDDLGLDAEASLVSSRDIEANPGDSNVRPALDVLLSLPVPPTAIFVSSDKAAFEVLQILKEKGINTPEDIAVVSFDGCLSNVLSGQLLTTMQLPIVEMGQAATDMLLAMINKEEVANKDMVFAPELVAGQSCGGKEKHKSLRKQRVKSHLKARLKENGKCQRGRENFDCDSEMEGAAK